MQGYGPKRVTCISAQSAAGAGKYVYSPGYALQTWVIEGTGVTSSGVVTLEEATWDPASSVPYAGTWSAITTVNASDVTGGAQKFVHIQATANGNTRPRISTLIGGGGTVSVYLLTEGN